MYQIDERRWQVMKETREKKTERIHMKIAPSVKEIAERNAEEAGRTLSNYIEWLILQDDKKKK